LAEEFEFAGQGMHRELSCAEYAPDGQYSHVFIVEFTSADTLPKAQPVHAWAPEPTLYFPAAHAVQAPCVPDQPALHEQLAIAAPPACKMEFAGHEMHSDLLFMKYVPAAQVQPRSTCPFDPALQIQLLMSMLSTGDEESGGQSKHTIEFAGQSIHEIDCPYWLARHPQLTEGFNVHQFALKPTRENASFEVNKTRKKGENLSLLNTKSRTSPNIPECCNSITDWSHAAVWHL